MDTIDHSQTLGFQTNSQSNRLTLGQTTGNSQNSRRSRSKAVRKSTISQAIDDINIVITVDGVSDEEEESDGYYEYESDSSVHSATDEDKHDGHPEDSWSSDISVDVDFDNKLPRPAANVCLNCGVGIQDGEVEWGCPHSECNGVVHDNCFEELPTDYKCSKCFRCWNNQ